MKRKLHFKKNGYTSGIISGDSMRDAIEIFPVLKDSFKQRKSFDEYYFEETEVEFNIEDLQLLNDKWFTIEITSTNINIED